MSKKEKKEMSIRYKIRMIVDIEGEASTDTDLRENTGIEPYIIWAAEGIEKALDGECEIVGVQKVELELVEEK